MEGRKGGREEGRKEGREGGRKGGRKGGKKNITILTYCICQNPFTSTMLLIPLAL